MSVTDAQLRKLTPDEIADYQENDYVVVHDFFSIAELEEVDREISRIQASQKDLGKNNGWAMQLGLRTDLTRQFAQDERVLTLIEDIVKPGISIFSGKLTAKLPNSEDICHWHQDDGLRIVTTPPTHIIESEATRRGCPSLQQSTQMNSPSNSPASARFPETVGAIPCGCPPVSSSAILAGDIPSPA